MSFTFRLRGRTGCKGVAEGEALVCHNPFVFLITEVQSGVITTPGHELEGKSIKDKVMVLPDSHGPSTQEWSLYERQKSGGATPKAVIYSSDFPHVCATIGNILTGIPMVYGFGENILEIIESGDRVKVNADKGIIEVIKKDA